MTKGQALHRNRTTGQDEIKNDLSENSYFWQSKKLKFQNTNLAQVAKDLESAYGQTIELADEATCKCLLSANFKDKSLLEIMKTITTIHHIEVKEVPGKIIWKGGRCK